MISRKITTLRLIAFITILPVLFFSLPASAAWLDPSFKFRTIETEHFRIHFHQGLDGLAEKTAIYAEEAYCVLTGPYNWKPEGKTEIALVDKSDFANGLTTVIPYNTIYLYPVPPMPDTTISRYDDWMKVLIFHEYAHVLTMDPVRGYSKVLRNVFGKTYPGADALSTSLWLLSAPPNIFLPYWWIEGTATWAETEFNPMGRGKGTYYEMIFRMAVAEDYLLSVDGLGGEIPYWPDGHAPYIYGLLLKRYLSKTYGNDIPGKLSIAHAGRLPFLIDGPPETLTGKSYEELYSDAFEDLRKEQSEKIRLLEGIAFTEHKSLDIKGEFLTHPRFSKDGGLLAVSKIDPHEHQGIVVYDGKEFKTIDRRPSDHNIAWMPDGINVCYTQAELRGGYNIYHDLYCYDLSKDKETRITDDLRIKDPDISPDGRYFTLVEVSPLSQNLALLDYKYKRELEKLTSFEDGNISGPRWSPDGERIAFSRRDNSGNTALYVYSLTDKYLEKILVSKSDNISPSWSPDGKFVVFSSDMTGVYNLFAYALSDGKLYQITHVLGGAFQPDVNGNRLVFSSYGSRGFTVAEIEYNPDNWRKKIGPPIKPYWPENEETTCKEKITPTETKAVYKKYSPFRSALPGFWLPTFQLFNNKPTYGIFTAGRDVLGYHTYYVNAGYGEGANLEVLYYYDRYRPTLKLRGYRRPTDTESGVEASVTYPFNRLERSLQFTAGYHLKRLDGTERRDNIFGRIYYSNALGYPYSISSEKGRTLSLTVKDYSKDRWSYVDKTEYIGKYEEFVGLGEHMVLYLELRGGYAKNGSFQLGGVPGDGGDFPLRGFPVGASSGKYIGSVSFEWRFPLEYVYKGIGTKPIFWERLHGSVFAETGTTWFEELKSEDIKTGIGAEAVFDIVVGYKLRLAPTFGAARGISKGGETRVYMIVAVKGI